MIRSFASKETESLFRYERVNRFRGIETVALRKLVQLDKVDRLEELKIPPGNRLEKLKGNRAGQWSIRINDQWRVCFRWQADGPHGVEIVDYH